MSRQPEFISDSFELRMKVYTDRRGVKWLVSLARGYDEEDVVSLVIANDSGARRISLSAKEYEGLPSFWFHCGAQAALVPRPVHQSSWKRS